MPPAMPSLITEPRAEPRGSAPDAALDIVRPTARPAGTTGPEDAALVAACRRGEQRAMEALYHQYKRRVFGLCHRIAGPGDAEEVAQEVFVRVFRGLPSFRGDSALGTWIYRLAVNAALSHVAKRARRGESVGAEGDDLERMPAPEVPRRDPRLSERVEAALARLPAGYRAILVLHDIEGLSHEECAAILDCRVGTSKSQLHKARAKMRELLGPAIARERAAAQGSRTTLRAVTTGDDGGGA